MFNGKKEDEDKNLNKLSEVIDESRKNESNTL